LAIPAVSLAQPTTQPSAQSGAKPFAKTPAKPVAQQLADASWLVLTAQGQGNTADGKSVAMGSEIPDGKRVKTGANGRLKLIHKAGVLVVLAPGTEVSLGSPGKAGVANIPQMVEGFARWVFRKGNPTCAKGGCRVGTSNAVLGIRGTDFVLIHNVSFKETEVVSFEGAVDFGSRVNEGDFRTVPSGFWGGIGGRYGQQIGPLLRVPPAVVERFKRDGALVTERAGGKSNAGYHGEVVPDGY
jgi:hypothetical protein